jgi:hypothetical protein
MAEIQSEEDYPTFIRKNYTIPQLKIILTHFNLKKTGNKRDLIERIKYHMITLKAARKIAKWWRHHSNPYNKYLMNKMEMMNSKKIPSFKRIQELEKTAVITDDFVSMNSVHELEHYQRVFIEEHGLLYGFNIASLIEYFMHSGVKLYTNTEYTNEMVTKCINPYTRNPFSEKNIRHLQRHIKLCHLLKYPIQYNQEPEEIKYEKLPLSQQVMKRTNEMFRYFAEFGFYTNSKWLLNLSLPAIYNLGIYLNDIWLYRSNMTYELRNRIVPNCRNGRNTLKEYMINIASLQNNYIFASNNEEQTEILNKSRMEMLDMFDVLCKKGVDEDSRRIGTTYVLSAITLVSPDAAETMPWLRDMII